eukprot:CAMPEP_0182466248 /NCGR_PEP_ID=MMETSP1319-20130603/11661_1 /TAXON_ID=172717 /ORGANISM="Bolidomonas pacifica, Strain RCC208" /LENGTH=253 /DNA_ID=CAMNT_0024666207 /DNA_START=100 /DNA_END=858 /DNA_ORIENTATION=+
MASLTNQPAHLHALGFCGADDSVDPHLLLLISKAYPFVEWGVLFRPDKVGTPRYASDEWVERLSLAARSSNGSMKLAAHLCGAHVNSVLAANSAGDSLLSRLYSLGFRRVQINATAVNGVDTSDLSNSAVRLRNVMRNHSRLQFILQRSEETKPLWSPFDVEPERNMSMLFDESKGTGALASSYSAPSPNYPVGYAGGIGPANISSVLSSVSKAAQGYSVWIDMESRLRSNKDGRDVFDLEKCYTCVRGVCAW